MKQLVKGSAALTAVSLTEMAMRFIRTKCIALILGPAGTGFLAQLGIFFELLRIWGDLGSRRGVIKQIAEIRDEGPQSQRYGEIVKTSYFLALVASTFTGLIVTIFSRSISISLYGTPEHYLFIIALAALLPFASFSTVTASILKGNLEYMSFAIYTFLSYLAVVIVTPIIIYFFHYWGAVVVQGLFFVFPLGAYLFFNYKKRFLFFSQKINLIALKEQFSYGFVQIYGDSLQQASRVLISAWVIKSMGLQFMGIYQVIITFSTVYLTIPIQVLSGYTMPVIAGAKTAADVNRAVNDALRFIVFILVPVIASVMIWPQFFIYCFFSSEFMDAAFPLEIQLLGTFFLLLAYPYAVAIQARGHLKAMLFIATLAPSLYVLAGWFLFDVGHLAGVASAYCLTSLSHLVMHYYFMRRYYKVTLFPKNQRLLICTCVWIALALLAGAVFQSILFRLVVTLLGIPWFLLSAKDHEQKFLVAKIQSVFKQVRNVFASKLNLKRRP